MKKKRILKIRPQRRVSMRTLSEIREKNKRTDLLISGIESTPITAPSNEEVDFYKNVIKPHVQNTFRKLSSKD